MSNSVEIKGSVTKAGVQRTVSPSGTARVTFSMSDSRLVSDKDAPEKAYANNWWNVVAYGKLIDLIERHVTAKTKVIIKGRIEQYNTKKDEEAPVKIPPRCSVVAFEILVQDGDQYVDINQFSGSDEDPF